jgi:manganese efflux pump family protein
MGIPEVFLIGAGLAMDCFAVSVSCGMLRDDYPMRTILRMAFFFALFQALMPLAGWSLGLSFEALLSSVDHWIAFGLLFIIGAKMILESFRKNCNESFNIARIPVLLSLSFATSIDALVVGMSFAFLKINIVLAVVIIGLVTFVFSMAGIWLGKRAGRRVGKRAGIAGGIVLIGIGVKVLAEHLFT